MTGIFKARTVEEAKLNASKEFGVSIDKIEFKIIREAKKGFLGFGSSDAEVEAVYIPDSLDNEKDNESIESDTEIYKENDKEYIKTQENEPAGEIAVESTPEIEDEDFDEYSLDNFTLIEDESLLHPKTVIARDYIISVLNAMGVEVETKIYQNETGAIINLESDNNGTIIGRRGETLDAIQYLSSIISNKVDKDYFRITVDCFGYREKRKATLQQLASKVAKNVLKTGRSQPLEPMNPYERRVIHAAVSEIEGVSSRSVGDEPYRKVIISVLNPKKRNSEKHNKGGKNFNNRRKSRKKEVDFSTSFEKEYKKPKPEDSIEGGLYGKIEF